MHLTMNFDKTVAEDFSILTNGVDNNIEIIRHNKTGFYNITKITTLFNKLKQESFDVAGIPATSKKLTKHWLENQTTKVFIDSCKRILNIDTILYELKLGIPKCYIGTYVHRHIYQRFMLWLDDEYAIKAFEILDSFNKEKTNKIIKEKEDKIDELLREVKDERKERREESKKHSEEMQELMKQNKELLGYAKTSDSKLDEANIKLDKIQKTLDSLSNIVKMTLPMWIGSSVLKTMLDKLKSDYKDDPKVIKCMKIAFVCGFYNENALKIYFCCTNFRDVSKRIGELFKRHNTRGDMLMMMPRAINLASCDINIELSTIRSKEFENINITMNNKSKSFDIVLSDSMNAEDTYDMIIKQLSESHLQIYQAHRDRVITEKKINVNTNIMKYITTSDSVFFDKARPLCQTYLEEFIKLHKDTHVYKAASRKQTRYTDFDNMQLTQPEYKLMFIDDIINKDSGIETFDEMVKNGEFNEDDIPVMEVIAATKLG